MEQIPVYECNNLNDVKSATKNLDKASMVLLKIDDSGVIKDVDNFKGIYNVSKGQFCTSVVPYYNLIQHKEYIDGFAEALQRLNIKYEMVIKQSGNRVFVDIEFPDKKHEFKKLNETFICGIRLVNSYDKTTGIFIVPRFKRLACMNGMIITSFEKTVSVKHTSKMVSEIEKFIELRLNDIISRYSDLQQWVSNSMEDSLEWKLCCGIIEKLFTQIKHREQILKNLGIDIVVVEDKKNKKKNVSYVWTDKDKKKLKFTRWELYNSITQYLSHGEHISPHIEALFHKRAERLFTTPLRKMPAIKIVI